MEVEKNERREREFFAILIFAAAGEIFDRFISGVYNLDRIFDIRFANRALEEKNIVFLVFNYEKRFGWIAWHFEGPAQRFPFCRVGRIRDRFIGVRYWITRV